ncbi:alpha/beta fold hydrolase [Emcibacter nanhaiensis]|uniref:Alpha/beta hydrolase n=1 Tax=Emcibacter nanhaiensis TaxID=1505037 RepID=A0A501PC90_9PROT|nr:alpha/beta hydrolase [Emcibacter nanhaiensis]TPD57514.1 alpha/beta hydrolase [Emcibacter nanhaiensis]
MSEQNYREDRYTSRDGLSLYYRVYENSNSTKTPLLCIHGITRNSKDFHDFASLMQQDRPVISMDVRGRGQSDYDPEYHNYQIPVYVADMFELMDHIGLPTVVVVGTSMGGLVGMGMAAVQPERVRAIVLNDVGPVIEQTGIDRIWTYVGKTATVRSWDQAANILKTMNIENFSDYTQDDWLKFANNTFREQQDGTLVADYDPHVGTAVRESQEAAVPEDMWPLFESLAAIPILCLHGAMSDILSAETVKKMSDLHPTFTGVTIAHRGHTPDLREDQSVTAIRDFLGKIDG